MGNKILFAGASLQCGNRGVNALTRGTITAILDRYGEIDLKLISYAVQRQISHIIVVNNRTVTIEEIPYTLRTGLLVCLASLVNKRVAVTILSKFFRRHQYLYNEISNADIIMDISAGDSFSDIYGFKRLLMNSVIKLSAIKLRKKTILLPQTMGPFNGFLAKRIAKYITENVTFNFVRDLLSYDVLYNELGIEKSKIKYIPDMAFYMQPDKNVTIHDFVPNAANSKEIVGINISALLYNGGYTQDNAFSFIVDYKELVNNIIDYFLQKEGVKILLVPHVICEDMAVEDDLTVCETIYTELREKYKDSIFVIDKPCREDELKNIIGQCNFFIGGRMHACIGAISMRVPTVPIAYSRKFIGIWNELGLSECVADPRYNSKEQILKTIDTNYRRRTEVKEILETKLRNVKDDILSMFELVENM